MQNQNAGARSQSREQIIKSETKRTDDAFQARSDHEERVKIEEKMERPEMEEQRGEHPPVFAAVTDRPRLERAQSVQGERTHRAAQAYFGNEHGDVHRDKNSDCERRPPRFRTESAGAWAICLFDLMKDGSSGRGKRCARQNLGAIEPLRDFGQKQSIICRGAESFQPAAPGGEIARS